MLFTGGREGYFQALDARNGRLLWKIDQFITNLVEVLLILCLGMATRSCV